MKDLIVVEYSVLQKCFHKSTVKEMLENNYTTVLKGKTPGFVPLDFFDNQDEADEYIKSIRSLLPND